MKGVSGPFGVGTMVAFTPFDGDREQVVDLVRALFDAGVIGLICGESPMRIRILLPPGSVTDKDVHAAMDIVKQTLGDRAW